MLIIEGKCKRCKVDPAWTAVFYHRNDAAESKMTRDMQCFTIETAVGGHEGRWCQTAVAVVFGLWSAMVGYVRLGSDRSDLGKCNCRLLDALQRWVEGGTGLQVAAPCCWGIARRVITVGSRCHWWRRAGLITVGSRHLCHLDAS